jgi:hypothetical protein
MPVGGKERPLRSIGRQPLGLTPAPIMPQNPSFVYGVLPYLLPGQDPIFMVGYVTRGGYCALWSLGTLSFASIKSWCDSFRDRAT